MADTFYMVRPKQNENPEPVNEFFFIFKLTTLPRALTFYLSLAALLAPQMLRTHES